MLFYTPPPPFTLSLNTDNSLLNTPVVVLDILVYLPLQRLLSYVEKNRGYKGAGWYKSRRWLYKSWRWLLLKLWDSSFKPALFFKNQGQYQLTNKWRVWIQNNWISWEIYDFLKFVEADWYNSVCYKQEFIFAFYDKKTKTSLTWLFNQWKPFCSI